MKTEQNVSVTVTHTFSAPAESVFDALDGFLALRLAPRPMHDVQVHTALQQDAMGQILEFFIDGLDELLAIDCRTQQRLKDRQQGLRFAEGKSSVGHCFYSRPQEAFAPR